MFGSGMSPVADEAEGVDPDVARLPSGTTCWRSTASTTTTRSGRKCRELGIAPTFHSRRQQPGPAQLSPTNFVYNHIGHFAAAGHAVSKAIFLGGVTRRFPDLRFAFLEGGVGWACQLFCDLIEHWERRGAKALANMDPTQARPRSCCASLVEKYGDPDIGAELDAARRLAHDTTRMPDGRRRRLDDFSAARSPGSRTGSISSRRRSTSAARPTTGPTRGPSARRSARRAAQRALQLGHRPLRRGRHARPAAGGLRAGRGRPHHREHFSDFVFANAVRLWGTQNPRFFEGTRVAKEAAALLKATTPARAAA